MGRSRRSKNTRLIRVVVVLLCVLCGFPLLCGFVFMSGMFDSREQRAEKEMVRRVIREHPNEYRSFFDLTKPEYYPRHSSDTFRPPFFALYADSRDSGRVRRDLGVADIAAARTLVLFQEGKGGKMLRSMDGYSYRNRLGSPTQQVGTPPGAKVYLIDLENPSRKRFLSCHVDEQDGKVRLWPMGNYGPVPEVRLDRPAGKSLTAMLIEYATEKAGQ